MFQALVMGISGGRCENKENELVLKCVSYLIKSHLSCHIYKIRRNELTNLQKQAEAFAKKDEETRSLKAAGYSNNTYGSSGTAYNDYQRMIKQFGARECTFEPNSSSGINSDTSPDLNVLKPSSNKNNASSRTNNGAPHRPEIILPKEVFIAVSTINYIQNYLSISVNWWDRYELTVAKLSKVVDESKDAENLNSFIKIFKEVRFNSLSITELFRLTSILLRKIVA